MVADTTRTDKPGEKDRIGDHARVFASREKAEATEVVRTTAPSEEGGGGTHVRARGFLLFVN
jgi:hypothetical protein